MKRAKKTKPKTAKRHPKKYRVEELLHYTKEFADYNWIKYGQLLRKIGKTRDDLEQMANLELLRLAKNQDQSKSASLKTRLLNRQNGMIRDILRKTVWKKRDYKPNNAIIKVIQNSKRNGQEPKIVEMVKRLSLTKKEKSCFNKRFGFAGQHEKSIKQIAAEDKVTKQSVFQSLYRIFQKLERNPEMKTLANLPKTFQERKVYSLQTDFFDGKKIGDSVVDMRKPFQVNRADLLKIVRSTKLGDLKTSERNQRIVIEWAGLNGKPPKSQAQLAKKYDLYESRISQILGMSFKKLAKNKEMQAFKK